MIFLQSWKRLKTCCVDYGRKSIHTQQMLLQEIKEDQEWVNEMRKKLDERLKELEQEKDKKKDTQ